MLPLPRQRARTNRTAQRASLRAALRSCAPDCRSQRRDAPIRASEAVNLLRRRMPCAQGS
jgi:hypothetical protein